MGFRTPGQSVLPAGAAPLMRMMRQSGGINVVFPKPTWNLRQRDSRVGLGLGSRASILSQSENSLRTGPCGVATGTQDRPWLKSTRQPRVRAFICAQEDQDGGASSGGV